MLKIRTRKVLSHSSYRLGRETRAVHFVSVVTSVRSIVSGVMEGCQDKHLEEYQKECVHRELFQGSFRKKWLEESFVEAIKLADKKAPWQCIMKEGNMTELLPNIYSLPVFKPDTCNMILEETENYIAYATKNDISIHRPNSMNKYGLVLSELGLHELLTDFQQKYLLSLSRAMFPKEGSHFTSHHSFIVSYQPDKDRSLDMHTDDSDVTWNICLGKEGFVASGLTFCGVIAQSDHRKMKGKYAHRIGHAVVHLGQQRHGADAIEAGERHNLIIWNKNDVYRESEAFDIAMRSYVAEDGPPDPQCLSYTHDRDYIAFKEYPEGCNPYRNIYESEGDEGNKIMMPWCPPPQFGYNGMMSHNKLMLLHYRRECEREDDEQSRENKSDLSSSSSKK